MSILILSVPIEMASGSKLLLRETCREFDISHTVFKLKDALNLVVVNIS